MLRILPQIHMSHKKAKLFLWPLSALILSNNSLIFMKLNSILKARTVIYWVCLYVWLNAWMPWCTCGRQRTAGENSCLSFHHAGFGDWAQTSRHSSKAYLRVISIYHGAESHGVGAESWDVTTPLTRRKQREQPGTRVRLSILNSCPWDIIPPSRCFTTSPNSATKWDQVFKQMGLWWTFSSKSPQPPRSTYMMKICQ